MAFLNRQRVVQCLIVLMLGAQLALAQHATVHSTPGYEAFRTAKTDAVHTDHDKAPHDKSCQICVLANGLSHALGSDAALALPAIRNETFSPPSAHEMRVRFLAAAYQARAPPALPV
jgi:hypothetical protein